MKIVCLKGGLGNQLFEYCRYRQLADACRERVWLYRDRRRLKSHDSAMLSEGFEVELPRVPLTVHLLVLFIKLMRELHLFPRLWDDERYDSLLIDDYSQDRRFITEARTALQFRQLPLSASAQSVMEQILSEPDSVAVHVRRGDYLHPSNLIHYGICPLDYYQKAVAYIRQIYPSAHLFFFSDDMEWTQSNLTFPSATYVHHDATDPDVTDLRLMSLCRHHIIANSTFSFWGAYLSRVNGINIYPTRWYVDPTWHIPNIFPKDWVAF